MEPTPTEIYALSLHDALPISKGAPAVHPQWPDNVAFTYHQDGGNIDKAFAEAEVVVKQRITSQRLVPMAMETRGVVAEWRDRKSTRLNSSHMSISYAVFCLKK